MKKREKPVFFPAVLFGILGTLLFSLVYFKLINNHAADNRIYRQLSNDVFVTEQISSLELRDIAGKYNAVVDLRPDGEAADQTSSQEIGRVSKILGINFFYVPIPHDNIPAEAVTKLGQIISETKGKTLLYCRSGNRATRTFALVQASEHNGPSESEILDMVKKAGHSADDLRDDIKSRINNRSQTMGAGIQSENN